jgi:xanthine dehydrogenase accessory factor
VSFPEIRSHLEAWFAAGERAAVAVLTECWSSAPRKPGARFARSESGSIGGNISAGCVEADLALRLDELLAGASPDLVTYGIPDETAAGVGLACGGTIAVQLEVWESDNPVWQALCERLDSGAPAMLVTTMDSTQSAHWLFDASGKLLASDSSGPPPSEAIAAGRKMVATGGARVLRLENVQPVFVEVLLPARRLIIVGATPVGAALARIALAAGIPVSVVEPRAAYRESLADIDAEIVASWPAEAFEQIGPDVSCAVAVVAHDERIDGPALAGALAAGCGYVGLLGGRRTREARLASLLEAGLSEPLVAAISSPIGLDIGAERPDEIAVAILAEVIGVWRGA